MESATFRKWLEERGCHFEQHERYKGQGAASVTVRRGERSADVPLVGSKKHLDPRIVDEVVDALGLDRNELPGPKSRV